MGGGMSSGLKAAPGARVGAAPIWSSAAPAEGKESQRDSDSQPKVGRPAALGKRPETMNNPNGVVALSATGTEAATPLGLKILTDAVPKVARASQPWALGRNPFGIDPQPWVGGKRNWGWIWHGASPQKRFSSWMS